MGTRIDINDMVVGRCGYMYVLCCVEMMMIVEKIKIKKKGVFTLIVGEKEGFRCGCMYDGLWGGGLSW